MPNPALPDVTKPVDVEDDVDNANNERSKKKFKKNDTTNKGFTPLVGFLYLIFVCIK